MMFQLGETYECGLPGFRRRAEVIDLQDGGRRATLRFLDDGSELTVFWRDIQATGRWSLLFQLDA
jgi:hypothetical protein